MASGRLNVRFGPKEIIMLEHLARARSAQSPSSRFAALLSHLQPTTAELAAYTGHKRTLETRLQQQLSASNVEIIGSHSRGTAIRGASDLDVLVRVPRDMAMWGDSLKSSQTVLQNVRDALSDRYTNTDIRRDGQAIVVNFAGGGRSVDVVPAIFQGMVDAQKDIKRRPQFLIPTGNGDWLPTSPQAHGAFIEVAEARSRGKLKYAAQLLKFWRHCRTPSIPALSFHFDMLLAADRVAEGAKSYQMILLDAFDLLRRRGCRALQDPMGISGFIPAAKSESQRAVLLEAANSAYLRARKAVSEEMAGRFEEASYYWNIIFNDCFPRRG
jgi:predicted nucleotidyltransferase